MAPGPGRGVRQQGDHPRRADRRTRRTGITQVANLIKQLRDSGLPIALISHDMPTVFELADRIHVQRLGRRAAVITPATHTMENAIAIMTGAATA